MCSKKIPHTQANMQRADKQANQQYHVWYVMQAGIHVNCLLISQYINVVTNFENHRKMQKVTFFSNH